MNIQMEYYFPTPIGVVDTEINTVLAKEYVLQLKEKKSSVLISNNGGWQSPPLQLDEIHNTPLQTIVEKLFEIFEKVNESFPANKVNNIGSIWLNVNNKGNSNHKHLHARSVWSGSFYIAAPENCGNFVAERADNAELVWLMDNQTPATTVSAQFQPKEGRLVFFPSWMPHLVLPSQSDQERISLSFNFM